MFTVCKREDYSFAARGSSLICRGEKMKSAVIYARVSSREQEKGYSISAQQKAIREYAIDNDFRVVAEFVDIESAGKVGRLEFGKMVQFIEKEEVDAIVCHKVDRLYRNFKDYVTIDDLPVKTLFVEEEYADNASGKFMQGIRVLMAKNYLDNLSDEVKKGVYEKLSQGGYPGKAPIGYINNKSERSIEVDNANSHFVKQAFKLYLTGRYSLKGLCDELYVKGFRSTWGEKVHVSGIQKILTNPFYYGLMRYNGKMYEGNHEPLIGKDLFDSVQSRLQSKTRPKEQKYSFALRGFMTCGECGKAITAEVQKGHVYYRCTKSGGNCSQPYVREEKLEEEIIEILNEVKIDKKPLDLLIKATKEVKERELEESERSHDDTNVKLKENRRLRKELLDGYLSKIIPADIYKEKEKELIEEKLALHAQFNGESFDDEFIFEQMEKFFKIAATAGQLYSSEDIETKRKLLSLIPSNLILENRHIVGYQLKQPFNLLAAEPITTDFVKLLGEKDSNPR